MFFKNRQMTGKPIIDRLINKRDRTFSEIHELNEELEVIKSVIQSKHQWLQKTSVQIIERQQKMQHIRLASSQPKWKVMPEIKHGDINLRKAFKCFEGGRDL